MGGWKELICLSKFKPRDEFPNNSSSTDSDRDGMLMKLMMMTTMTVFLIKTKVLQIQRLGKPTRDKDGDMLPDIIEKFWN